MTTEKDQYPTAQLGSLAVPPKGFRAIRLPRQTWWVKSGWEEFLPGDLDRFPSAPDIPYSTLLGGRGTSWKMPLDDKETAIVRHYCRGGLIRHFVRDLYWDRPPRPWAELICTEVARQRGVPTVEVLAAGVAWVTICLYRGTLVTREAEGFVNLWEWLSTRPTGPERETMTVTIAQTIARMHDAGIAHADLNLTNILVRANTDLPAALVIDFDRARVFSGPVPQRRRERNLRRLRRSLDKLDSDGLLTFPTDVEIFCQAYRRHSPS